jgi:glucose/arabinose dehydrogenase
MPAHRWTSLLCLACLLVSCRPGIPQTTAAPEPTASARALAQSTPAPSTPTPVASLFAPLIQKQTRLRSELLLPLLLKNVTGLQGITERNPAPFDPLTTALALEKVAEGLFEPVRVTHAGDSSGRLFVLEKAGTIRIVRDKTLLDTPFLDLTALVGSMEYEQGLLGLAFHPQYKSNGLFFVNYTDKRGDTVIARYRVSNDPNRADPTSVKTILTIEQPFDNHNGGHLAFGPDGYLYIGMGDGGYGGDPFGHGQNRGTLLGKLLRIDIERGDPYAIPPTNPFVGQSGARGEVWALGLRNPWQFSFDRATGDLYIGDVGQERYEEINFQPAASRGGENYGWVVMEGNQCNPPDRSCNQTGLVLPVAVYGHVGCASVTGGYVYRGYREPLVGAYFYADYCRGRFWALIQHNGRWLDTLVLDSDLLVTGFGEDEVGEIYVVNLSPGEIYRLVAAPLP